MENTGKPNALAQLQNEIFKHMYHESAEVPNQARALALMKPATDLALTLSKKK